MSSPTKYPLSEHATHYINTDLDIASPKDASEFAAFLDAKGWSIHHAGWHPDGHWLGVFEHPRGHEKSPEHAIGLMLDLLEKMPAAIRFHWDGCDKREFNIGYQSGYEPHAFEQGISSALLGRVSAAGASLGITIYEPTDTPPAKWLTKK